MTHDRPPAFQFYPRDFLCDAHVMAMDLSAVGAYWMLVSVCWLESGLPSDPDCLSRMLRVSREVFDVIWAQCGLCFYLSDGRYQHKRLDHERAKQRKYSRAMSLNGRKGGKPRDSRGKAEPKPNGSRTEAEQSSASASASASVEVRTAPAKSVFVGKRSGLTLFQWQWDEIHTRLGPKASAFRLAEFCEQIDAEIAETGTAAPWPYLLGRLVTIAGLPQPHLTRPGTFDRPDNVPSADESARRRAALRAEVSAR